MVPPAQLASYCTRTPGAGEGDSRGAEAGPKMREGEARRNFVGRCVVRSLAVAVFAILSGGTDSSSWVAHAEDASSRAPSLLLAAEEEMMRPKFYMDQVVECAARCTDR